MILPIKFTHKEKPHIRCNMYEEDGNCGPMISFYLFDTNTNEVMETVNYSASIDWSKFFKHFRKDEV